MDTSGEVFFRSAKIIFCQYLTCSWSAKLFPLLQYAKISFRNVVMVWSVRDFINVLGTFQIGNVAPSIDFDLHHYKSCLVWIMVGENHVLYHSKPGRKYGETKVLVSKNIFRLRIWIFWHTFLCFKHVFGVSDRGKSVEFINLINTISQNSR